MFRSEKDRRSEDRRLRTDALAVVRLGAIVEVARIHLLHTCGRCLADGRDARAQVAVRFVVVPTCVVVVVVGIERNAPRLSLCRRVRCASVWRRGRRRVAVAHV